MMTSYFNLLKYAATGIASPDMSYFDKMRASTLMGGVVQTLTGQPPLSFKSDGSPLISWSMLGNGSQTGTPTPSAPIMPEMCGVRTGNLCLVSQSNSIYYAALNRYSVNNNSVTVTGEALFGFVCKASPNTDYAVSAYADKIGAHLRIREYSDVPTEWSTNFVKQPLNKQLTTYSDASFTTDSSTNYLLVVFYTPPTTTQINIFNIMLNSGSEALPYEPYGYKIPLTNAGQTVPIYLGQVSTVRRIKKLVLTGEEKVTPYTGYGAQNCFFVSKSGVTASEGLCNFYTNVTNLTPWINTNNSFMVSANTIRIHDGRFSEVSELEGFLAAQYAAGTPVTVWYVLATPETAIVNEPLCKISTYADELSSTDAGIIIPTAKGDNTLTVDMPIQPSEMTITVRMQ